MNIPEIVSILTNSGIEKSEAVCEVKMLIEHFCNYGAKDILMGKPLDYEKLKIVYEKAELRAKTKMPIQYIIGKSYFMGKMYTVTPDVLIPRDETEIVVRHGIDIIRERGLNEILDIGTGSGCIACTIARLTKKHVVSVDISKSALKVARENARSQALRTTDVEFIQSDLFESLEGRKFDFIISNPPYIPKGTILQEEVQKEPALALFADGEQGEEFYKKIIEQAPHFLNKEGFIVFELGINQSELVQTMLEKNNYTNIKIEKDLSNIDRTISAQLK
jgi:release factor glutamine methyltransferase